LETAKRLLGNTDPAKFLLPFPIPRW